MKKTVDIIGLQLISITEGKKLGTIKSLVIDAAAGNVTALVVEDNKWYVGAKFLPLSAVSSIGEYAVTTMNSDVLLPVTEAPEIEKLLEDDIKVIGTKVLTTSGKIQGTVTELLIDDSGKIMECEVEDNDAPPTVTADRIVTFGKEVLVINEAPDASAASPAVKPKTQAPTAAKVQPTVTTAPAAESLAPAAPTTPAEPVENTVENNHHEDAAAKKFDERQRKYLLGKKATRRITTDNGVVIVDNGGEITEEVLQKAKLAGKFVELSMSI